MIVFFIDTSNAVKKKHPKKQKKSKRDKEMEPKERHDNSMDPNDDQNRPMSHVLAFNLDFNRMKCKSVWRIVSNNKIK